MSLKSILTKASLIATASFGSIGQAETLSPETIDFLNQGNSRSAWTERVKLETPKNAYRVTEIGSIKENTFQESDINQTYDMFGNTPLGLAVLNGRAEIVSDLIRQGADINQENRRGKRPITEALISRADSSQMSEAKYQIIEMLCKAGAELNFKDSDNETPLQVAANRMDGRAMKILQKYGADTSVKNEYGETPEQTYKIGLNYNLKNKFNKNK